MEEPATSALDMLCSDIELFDAEKRIVQYILDHPRRASNMTSARTGKRSIGGNSLTPKQAPRL